MPPQHPAAALGEKLSELCFRLGTVFADWAKSLDLDHHPDIGAEVDAEAPQHALLSLLNHVMAAPAHGAQAEPPPTRSACATCCADKPGPSLPRVAVSQLVASVTNSTTELAATPSPPAIIANTPTPQLVPLRAHTKAELPAVEDRERHMATTSIPPSPPDAAAQFHALPVSRSHALEQVGKPAYTENQVTASARVCAKRKRAESESESESESDDAAPSSVVGCDPHEPEESAQGTLLRGSSKRPRMAWTMDETTSLFNTVDRVPHGSENEVAHAIAVALGGRRTFEQCKARMRALRTAGFISCTEMGRAGAAGDADESVGSEERQRGAMKWCVMRRAKKRVRLNWTAGEKAIVRDTIVAHAEAGRDELVNTIALRLGGDRTSYQVRRHLNGLVKTGKVRYCESGKRRWLIIGADRQGR